MYCKKCGNLLDENDLACNKCGTEVAEHINVRKSSEDIEKLTSDQPGQELSWNVHDFPAPKKTEEVNFDWGPDPYEALIAKNKKKSSQEVKEEKIPAFNSENEDKGQNQEDIIKGKELEEVLFQNIKGEADTSLKDGFGVDKFFTFSKRNEEFQKLLDLEYEKIKEHSNFNALEPEKICPLSDKIEISQIENNNDNTISGFLKEDIKKDLNEIKQDHKIDKSYIDEMTIARESYFLQNEDNKHKEKESIPLESHNEIYDCNYKNEFPKNKFDTIDITVNSTKALKVEVAMKNDTQSQVRIIPEPDIEELSIREIADAKPENDVKKMDTTGFVNFKEEEEVAKSVVTPTNLVSENMATTDAKETFVGRKQEKPQRNWMLKTVLCIIAIILVFELSFLGIKFFIPDSEIAQFLNKKVAAVSSTFSELAGKEEDKEDDKTKTNEDKETAQEIKPKQPNPVPVEDKNILISNQKEKNVNIISIRANDDLKYMQDRKYEVADINNSVPIANNIWRTLENGDSVYYDNEIVGTLISFNSQWVDYVNGGSNAVLDLVKEGSPAERNAVTFSKVGKVKETFNLLEVGEIRKGATYYYVWCHEEIQVVEGGNTSVTSNNWIYALEPIGDKIQIVNYYKF